MGKFNDWITSAAAGPEIQAGLGVLQAGLGAIQRASALKGIKKLEKSTPKYQQSQGILDYYNQALNRFNVSPTESALYKRQQKNIGRNVATGISGLQREGNVLGGVSSLVRGASDAALNAEVAAEQQQAQRFGALGQAAQMKRGEEAMAYQQNVVSPFERKYNLLAQKAGGGTSIANAGFGNIGGAGSTLAQMQIYKNLYGKS